MPTNPQTGNGSGEHARIGERLDQLGADAQTLIDDARGAVHDLGETLDLRGRVERNPYRTLLMAAGIGYLLGGGLFTPLTARMLRFGMKLAALPLVKDELLGMAERAIDGMAGEQDAPPGGGPRPGGV